VDGDRIHLEQDGKDVLIAHANIVKAKLVPDYAALGFGAAPPKKEHPGARKRAPKHK
jgi:ribosome maturation factor RimP